MLQRYRTLAAALALREFTVQDIARLSGVKPATVRTVLKRERRFVEKRGTVESTGRGGRYLLYRLRADVAEELVQQLRELEGVSDLATADIVQAEGEPPDAGESRYALEADRLSPLVSAEALLLDEYPKAESPNERGAIVRLARLAAADSRVQISRSAQPNRPTVVARQRAVALLLRLTEVDATRRHPPPHALEGLAEESHSVVSALRELEETRLAAEVETRVLSSRLTSLLRDEDLDPGTEDLRTLTGRVAQFLRALDFEVKPSRGGLIAIGSSSETGPIVYLLFITQGTVPTTLDDFATFFDHPEPEDRRLARRIIAPESALRSPSHRSRLEYFAPIVGASLVSASEFMRSFFSLSRLEAACRRRMEYHSVIYIEPTVQVGGRSMSAVEFIDRSVLARKGSQVVVVHAPGGRGKTLLAEYVAHELFLAARKGGPIPFLIKFHEVRGITEIDFLLLKGLSTYGLERFITVSALKLLIEFGYMTLILDGFDELTEKAGEQQNAENIGKMAESIHQQGSGRAVLTCRSVFMTTQAGILATLQTHAGQPLLVAELQPFDDPRINEYLRRNPPSREDPERHRQRVWSLIQREGRVAAVAREPLILATLSDLVHESKFNLPSNVARVYERLVLRACDREKRRHSLPDELQQLPFLTHVAEYMAFWGEQALEPKRIVVDIIEPHLGSYLQSLPSIDKRQALIDSLLDHYMFSPREPGAASMIEFRHLNFRDFLIAYRLALASHDNSEATFSPAMSRYEVPDEAIVFLAELLPESAVALLRRLASSPDNVVIRNLVRLCVLWESGFHFGSVFGPEALRRRDLSGLTFEDLDLRRYSWEGTRLDSAVFRNCDLRGADFSLADMSLARLEACSLAGARGDSSRRARVMIDGGEHLIHELGSLHLATATSRRPDETTELILQEIFAKVIEGSQRDEIRISARRPRAFERGAVSGAHEMFVRHILLPDLVKRQYLKRVPGRHALLAPDIGRLDELLRYRFEAKLSGSLRDVVKRNATSLSAATTGTGRRR